MIHLLKCLGEVYYVCKYVREQIQHISKLLILELLILTVH